MFWTLYKWTLTVFLLSNFVIWCGWSWQLKEWQRKRLERTCFSGAFLEPLSTCFCLRDWAHHVSWAIVFNFKASCCIWDLKKACVPQKYIFQCQFKQLPLSTSIASPILKLLQLQKTSTARTRKEKCLGQMLKQIEWQNTEMNCIAWDNLINITEQNFIQKIFGYTL